MSIADRMKESIFALVRAALPTVDYFALYRARVVQQSADLATLELQPDDPRLPGMSEVPIKLGLPAAKVKISPGAFVLVGWEGGNPQRTHALVWETGATALQLTLEALKIELGGAAPDALIKGTSYRTAEDTMIAAMITTLGGMATAAGTPPLTPLAAGFTALATALTSFQTSAAGAAGFLSTVVTTR